MSTRFLIAGSLIALLAGFGARAEPLPGAAAPGPPAAPVATMRSGDHGTFGRVVIDLSPGVVASATGDATGVEVHVVGGALRGTARPPRNVTAITLEGTDAHLTLAPGATFTAVQLLAHLVIDVFPPGATTTAAPKATPAPASGPVAAMQAPPRFSGPPPRTPRAMAQAAATPSVAGAAPPARAPRSPPAAASLAAAGSPEPVRMSLQRLLDGDIPAALRAPAHAAAPSPKMPATAAPTTDVERAELPPPGAAAGTPAVAADASAPPAVGAQGPLAIAAHADGSTLLLPFAPGTGAAAFRRGAETVVVFDERRPVDLAASRDNQAVAAGFAGSEVQLLPAATVLRLVLPPGDSLRLSRTEDGWALDRVAQPPAVAPIRGDVADGALRLPAASPGTVVSVPDPQTGSALLVGTQTRPGQGVAVARRTPDFALLETLQGVVVDPVSDALTLRVAPAKQFSGFVLESGGGPGARSGVALDALGQEAVAALDAAHMTRRWDFPALPADALSRRLQAATQGAAAAPPQGRTAQRLNAVQAQLALGLGAEADALANITVADDGRAAEQPDVAGLTAVAALLAGRLDEADAIADPRLDGSDEVALWRAVRGAMQHEGAPAAAAGFASTLPLLLAYPEGLRQRLLPLATETMVLGGEPDTARRLLDARKDDGGLDYARALLAERDGHAAAALVIYDRLAQSSDRRERARAAVRAAELRLRTGAMTTVQAADALDHLIYAWRGDRQELALRLRVADLRASSGNWRAALALLRETGDGPVAESWPDQKPAIRARMGEVFAKALDGDAHETVSPLELVSLVEENPDLLPDGEAGRALAARVADRMLSLDLPKRGGPVLEKLMTATPPGPAKAEVGARLATLRLRQNDPAGALETLSDSTAPDLPPAVEEERTILFARATAERGAIGPATAALAALGTAAADEARASLFERANDWPGAVAALASYAQKTVPADGPLAEVPARTLLRLASAAARAGDEALLGRLRDRELPRMPAGQIAEMFRVLTEGPVQGVADLPRAAQEAALARGVPAALKSLGAAAPPP